jgi:hypothetical protein
LTEDKDLKMRELRPIGTEIEYCFPPNPRTTNPKWVIWKYRIKGHAETSGGPCETLDPIDMREFAPSLYVHWMGELKPVPPRECLPFLDEGWHLLFEKYGQAR